jgi:hypothetical protein
LRAPAPPTTAPSTDPLSTHDAQEAVDKLQDEVSVLKETLALKKEEISHLSDIAKLLLTVTGIFTIVLGGASWKALEDQRRSSRESLDSQKALFDAQLKEILAKANDSLQEVGRLREELERDFPMFGRMRSNFSKVLSGLASACSRLKMEDNTYSELSWDEEQLILFYESAISTSLLLHTSEYAKQLSEIYRLLGMFYGSKFNSALPDGKFSESPDRRDIDRSRFYFDRSIQFDEQNYAAYMNAGHFTYYSDDEAMSGIARDYYQRAAASGPAYQKPWISMALIELEPFKRADRAIAALAEASTRSEYDAGRPQNATDYIAYLRACALGVKARDAKGDDCRRCLESAMSELEQASGSTNDNIRKMFQQDRSTYFVLLDQDSVFHARYLVVAQRLTAPDGSADGGAAIEPQKAESA